LDSNESQTYCFVKTKWFGRCTIPQNSVWKEALKEYLGGDGTGRGDSKVSAFLAEFMLVPNKSLQEGCVSLQWYFPVQDRVPLLWGWGGSPLLPEGNTVSKILAVCFLQNKCNLRNGLWGKY